MTPKQMGCLPVIGIVLSATLVFMGAVKYPIDCFFPSENRVGMEWDWEIFVRTTGAGIAIYCLLLCYLRFGR